jgi:hypothetical protein
LGETVAAQEDNYLWDGAGRTGNHLSEKNSGRRHAFLQRKLPEEAPKSPHDYSESSKQPKTIVHGYLKALA